MQKPQKFRNRLADETSPYLLQHAHNPVDWFPWGEEAFIKARKEDKPILLSIGYSACHWCHVMAHESFENEKTAELMNENFINIKVDMEERPDVDKIYMNFVQLTTGSGGWPLTAFLTPDQKPFFGGTYFPPVPRFNMPSFEQILTSVSEAYRNRRDDVLKSAGEMVAELEKVSAPATSGAAYDVEMLDVAYESFVRTLDHANGGFGGAPKFPAPMALEFLLRYYKRTGETKALEIVKHTCNKMAHGGIFDQLGGGFHRYSVDAEWLVPHFEKMLYDNAQLARIYLHLFQVTGDEFYRNVVERILDYVTREMLDESGGFYSAQDADSEGVEGKFFVWSLTEIEDALGKDDGELFAFMFDVTKEGNFEGENILNIKHSMSEAASKFGVSEDLLHKRLNDSVERLFEAREKRIKPLRDEKVLTAWNGLMLTAFAEAGGAFEDKQYLSIAINNAEFLLSSLKKDGKLLRTWKSGEAKLDAYLEDYANLADALLELFRVTGTEKYLIESKKLVETMIEKFWDDENGGFFFTASDHEELLVRSKDFNDNATPSGNAVAFDVIAKLAKLYGDETLRRYAETGLRIIGGQLRKFPGAFGRSLATMEFTKADVKEIVVVGDEDNDLRRFLNSQYLPTTVQFFMKGESEIGSDLLKGKETVDGRPAAYVCENFTCAKPVTSIEALNELIR